MFSFGNVVSAVFLSFGLTLPMPVLLKNSTEIRVMPIATILAGTDSHALLKVAFDRSTEDG